MRDREDNLPNVVSGALPLFYPPFDDPDFRRLYPFLGRSERVNTFTVSDSLSRTNLRMNFLDEGSGPPVVMVHGNPTWSYYWRNLIAALKGEHRCIALDHIGCGLSDKPPASVYDYSLKSRIDDLEALLDHLGIQEKITLVVQDWGGMIGLGYAARHPERIARIVASNTGCSRLPQSKGFPYSLWLGRNTKLGEWLILNRNAFCRLAAKWCVTRRPLPPDVREMYLKPYDSPAHRIAVLKFVQTIPLQPSDPGYDIVLGVEEAAAKLRSVPTLLLWGMKDFVFDRHFLAEWQRLYPHAITHTWPDCGHYLFEDATDEAIAKVKEFFTRHPVS